MSPSSHEAQRPPDEHRETNIDDEATNQDGNDGEIVYLFSSASRARYTEDIYNSMAYPPDFIIQFRYRRPWWGPEIKEIVEQGNYSELREMDAVVVAAPYEDLSESELIKQHEEDGSKYSFFPLRNGTIIDVSRRGDSLHLYLQLGRKLVKYPEREEIDNRDQPFSKYTNLIQDFECYPRLGYEDNDDDVFVACESDVLEYIGTEESKSEWHDEKIETAWNASVNNLGKISTFEGTLFYRLTKFSKIGEQSNSKIAPRELYSEKYFGYVLSSSDQYLLELSLKFAGSPPDSSRDANLKVMTSEKIESLPSQIGLGFSTDEQEIIVDPITGLDPLNTSLIIDSDAEFWTPDLNIPIRVDPSRRKYLPFGLLASGIILVIISSHLVSLGHFIYSSIFGGDFPFLDRSIGELIYQLLGTVLSVLGVNLYGAWLDL